jgi:hypothetical protein
LVRNSEGKTKRYDDFSELVRDLERENNREILILVRREALKEVTGNEWVESDVIAENSETAIVFVKIKN